MKLLYGQPPVGLQSATQLVPECLSGHSAPHLLFVCLLRQGGLGAFTGWLCGEGSLFAIYCIGACVQEGAEVSGRSGSQHTHIDCILMTYEINASRPKHPGAHRLMFDRQVAPPHPTFLPAAARVVAIGDLHGDLHKARRAFRVGGLIDERDRWVGGTTTAVQVCCARRRVALVIVLLRGIQNALIGLHANKCCAMREVLLRFVAAACSAPCAL